MSACLRGFGVRCPTTTFTPYRVWGGLAPGTRMLRRAVADGFTVLLTVDRNLEYQQDVPGVGLAIVALRAHTNDIVELLPLMSEVLTALPTVAPGRVTRIPS